VQGRRKQHGEVMAATAVREPPQDERVEMSASVTDREDPAEQGPPWYEGLAFAGPMDPAGTAFALVLAVAGTIGMIVLTAAIIRLVSG
jgi:hypothetical protein